MKHNQDPFPEFLQNLEQHQMVGDDSQKVLLAVSGGPDSMALLHLFFRWNPSRIGVWHLNHGFRPRLQLRRRWCGATARIWVFLYSICCLMTAFIRQSENQSSRGAFAISCWRNMQRPRV